MDHSMIFWARSAHEQSLASHCLWTHSHSVIHILIIEERSWRIHSPWAIASLHCILRRYAMIISYLVLRQLWWLAESIMVMVHYHKFILAFLEHLLEYFWVVNTIIVLHSGKLGCCLSIGSHVIESLLFTCFAVVFSMWSWWRSILIENLVLVDDLIVVMVVDICFVTNAVVSLPLCSWMLFMIVLSLRLFLVFVFLFDHLWVLSSSLLLLFL